jgi:hypothetical protein
VSVRMTDTSTETNPADRCATVIARHLGDRRGRAHG